MSNDPENTVEAEDPSVLEVDDAGSGYETNDSVRSETTSLASSLEEYVVENGRRYHAYYGPDKNLMPTDEIEQERLDLHHEIMLLISNKELHKAPLENPQRVLDLGTGTGIWAIDFAHEHPEAEVIGLDLSPIQPNWVPPNCRFEVDDFELEWTYQKDTFDFIHARNIGNSVKEWSNLLPEVMSHLKPGAWFEMSELGFHMYSDDNTLPDDWPPKVAFDYARSALPMMGRKIPTAEGLEKLLVENGFAEVQVKTIKEPMGPWPKNPALKQAGALFVIASETSYHAYCMALLTRAHGFSPEDADALCWAAYAAHADRKSKVHAYNHFYVAYGRRPLE